jgi:hypothetical protein
LQKIISGEEEDEGLSLDHEAEHRELLILELQHHARESVDDISLNKQVHSKLNTHVIFWSAANNML